VVSLITVTIWLYAEAESLGRESVTSRIDIIAGRDDIAVREVDGFDGNVNVELSGSKSALTKARQILDRTLQIDFAAINQSVSDGRTPLRLVEALAADERLARSGVVIESVRPPEVLVEVRTLVRENLPIKPMLPNVQLGGELTIDPPTASVRLPKALFESEGTWLEVIARPSGEQLARLPDGGPVSLPVPLALPDSLRGVQGVELLTQRATLSFSIKSTLVSTTLTAPVQVLLPSIEQSEWTVTLSPDDAILDVSVSGPPEVIARLKSPSEGLIAILAISSDELATGITNKPVSFAVLKGGAATPAPASLVLPPQAPSVRFSCTRRTSQ
jgi:hypothetical protein